MGHAALLFAVLALLLGVWPLFPQSSTLGLVAAVAGLLPALFALGLALRSRSHALAEGRPLGLFTAALGLAVAAALGCGFWLLSFLFFLLTGGRSR